MKKPKEKTNPIKNLILTHVNNNIIPYIIVLIFLFIGIVLGVIFINNIGENELKQLNSYIMDFVNSIKDNSSIDRISLLKNSIKENILLTLILWFVGSTVIGLPIVYGIIAFRGFCLSYTISAIISTLGLKSGIIFVLTSILLQSIIFIPCILALAVSGTNLYKSIMKDKRKENVKLEIIRHTIFSAIICIVLIISSFIEVFVSTNLFNICVKFI